MRLGATAATRQADFLSRLEQNRLVRLLEAHSGLSAAIVERASIKDGALCREFDGIWVSSLTDSTVRGLPDVEIVGNAERLETVYEVCGITNKGVLVDGDTGGAPAQLEHFVRNLERAGASGVIIEDKRFPKRNSLDSNTEQTLEDPPTFAAKIARGRAAAAGPDFLVIARLESLIAGETVDDALARARLYAAAGADGIMIHSRSTTPDEVFEFADRYQALCRSLGRRPYLVCVPTTYNEVPCGELARRGFNIVIHANHLLRAAYRAMTQAAEAILIHDRSLEASESCSTVTALFDAVGYEDLKRRDADDQRAIRSSASSY
jgi:phosphoenolpyruvate phosphomutase